MRSRIGGHTTKLSPARLTEDDTLSPNIRFELSLLSIGVANVCEPTSAVSVLRLLRETCHMQVAPIHPVVSTFVENPPANPASPSLLTAPSWSLFTVTVQ